VPEVVNLGLAAERLWGAGELRLVAASEVAEGRDLDGDGDTLDFVLHVLELDGGGLRNTGLALPQRFQRDEVAPPMFGASDALGVFAISEAETGVDLDQDGDPTEVTTWIYDRRTQALRNLGLAHTFLSLDGSIAAFHGSESGAPALMVFDVRDGSLVARPVDPQLILGTHEDVVAFTRWEEGAFDLNADGDTADVLVLHLYDSSSRRVINTGFDLATTEVRFSGDFVGFLVAEARSGALDLNGDGDSEDQVFVALDLRRGTLLIPALPGAAFADFPGAVKGGFLLRLGEEDGDRNGDGDTADRVAALYDPATERVIETSLAVGNIGYQAERWLGLQVPEGGQGAEDLDGDGVLESSVPHVFDTRTGRIVSLGVDGFWIGVYEDQLLAVTQPAGSAGYELLVWNGTRQKLTRPGVDARNLLGSADGRALLSLREGATDLNGDGDTDDFVLALHEKRSGTVQSLGLATSTFQGYLAEGGSGAVLVSESAQGADLNSDGDLADQVLFELRLE